MGLATLTFTGAGVHQTILITVASRPPQTARLGVKLDAANQVTQSSCTPK